MKYKNFEEIPVWNDAIALTVQIFHLTEDAAFRGRGDIANQIQRASLSISNNIAEGFERGTTNELLQFLYYAKGSAGEVRSILYVIEKINAFSHLKSDIAHLKPKAVSISKQLGGWSFSLQESDIKGSRHLTEKSKSIYHQKQHQSKTLEKIRHNYEESMKEILQNKQP
jgi:four helix bundle protein